MKLVCHIGTPKTASTFLQNTCAANEKWLRNHGVVYPEMMSPTPNHITLFYANAVGVHDFARDFGLTSPAEVARFRKTLSDGVARQIDAAPRGTHTMLMSSENLTGNLISRDGIARLKNFLAPHFDEISILVYLRRQDDAILSMYAEFMRRGFRPAVKFQRFLELSIGPKSFTPFLFYRTMLSRWIEVFGEEAINVRLFDRGQMRGGNILVDFFTEVLGQTPDDIDALVPSPDENISLSAPALEYLRFMHALIPYRKGGVVNQERAMLDGRINALPSSPRPKMSKAQSERIMRHFKPANTWLQKTFFPDHDGPIFPPKDESDPRGNLGEVTVEDFARFTRILFP